MYYRVYNYINIKYMPTIRKKRGNGSIIFFESRLILKINLTANSKNKNLKGGIITNKQR